MGGKKEKQNVSRCIRFHMILASCLKMSIELDKKSLKRPVVACRLSRFRNGGGGEQKVGAQTSW